VVEKKKKRILIVGGHAVVGETFETFPGDEKAAQGSRQKSAVSSETPQQNVQKKIERLLSNCSSVLRGEINCCLGGGDVSSRRDGI